MRGLAPRWNGFAAGVAWPSVHPAEEVFRCAQRAVTVAMVTLA